MTEGQIQQKVPVSIQEELRTSYLDYAMSVIIGRAIPDIRDGLKPVHRRILYSMQEQGITHSGSYKKCARVVGDVLGKYHPHGDTAVYDALVRMAQEFSLRVPLVDGQGNYGSIDGDSAAAMRYTECKLAAPAAELLEDLDKDTVDFVPNYDESEREPSVLPAKFPNLLVNGSGGIAVGMATNIPPHHLGEVIDATIALIEDPEIDIAGLMQHIPGPDFPTGAIIHGHAGILQAYTTGRGSIVMRGRADTEAIQGSNDREQIVITEVPYQCNKARLVSRIAGLAKEKRVEGISEVRDESNRDGIRVVVELKKDVYPQVVLNQLYRLTPLQTSFGVINLAIVHGRPKVLDLKETLSHFVEHRRDVVRRRSRYELKKAEARKELVEGLGMAVTDIDAVVSTIRQSRDPEEARARLMDLELLGLGEFLRRAGRPEEEAKEADESGPYRLSERQAKAILEMRLARLTGLEREKLAAEYRELGETIDRLVAILSDEGLLMKVITDELVAVKEKHTDPRRTEIVADEAEINIEDLIQEEDMAVTISHAGYIKRTSLSNYRAQHRGGKGKTGMSARDEDSVKSLFVANTHSYVFFFSNKGIVYVKKVYQIPEGSANARGRAIVNFVGLDDGEYVAAILNVSDIEEGRYVVTLTRKGQIKKTSLFDYKNYRETGLIGVRIDEGDELLDAVLTDGNHQLLIGTKQGLAIRFPENKVRSMGRATRGVKAIDIGDGDEVVGFTLYKPEDTKRKVLTICEKGYGKQTDIDEFRLQNRGGKGVILISTSDRNGPVVGLGLVGPEEEVIMITDGGQALRTRVEEIRETGRNAQGVAIMNVSDDERIVAVEMFTPDEDEEDEASEEDVAGADAEGADASPEGADGDEADAEGADGDEAQGDDAPSETDDAEPGADDD